MQSAEEFWHSISASTPSLICLICLMSPICQFLRQFFQLPAVTAVGAVWSRDGAGWCRARHSSRVKPGEAG